MLERLPTALVSRIASLAAQQDYASMAILSSTLARIVRLPCSSPYEITVYRQWPSHVRPCSLCFDSEHRMDSDTPLHAMSYVTRIKVLNACHSIVKLAAFVSLRELILPCENGCHRNLATLSVLERLEAPSWNCETIATLSSTRLTHLAAIGHPQMSQRNVTGAWARMVVQRQLRFLALTGGLGIDSRLSASLRSLTLSHTSLARQWPTLPLLEHLELRQCAAPVRWALGTWSGPADGPSGPADGPSGPADGPSGPAVSPSGPADGPAGPADGPAGPADGPAGPADGPAGPADGPAEGLAGGPAYGLSVGPVGGALDDLVGRRVPGLDGSGAFPGLRALHLHFCADIWRHFTELTGLTQLTVHASRNKRKGRCVVNFPAMFATWRLPVLVNCSLVLNETAPLYKLGHWPTIQSLQVTSTQYMTLPQRFPSLTALDAWPTTERHRAAILARFPTLTSLELAA
jgi:hypothetical protein